MKPKNFPGRKSLRRARAAAIVDAVDEYTLDNHGEFPPEYARKRAQLEHRELVIDVAERAVRALFDAPEVIGVVVPPSVSETP